MRLILEKDEIVRILSHRFETELDPATVVIRTEPTFEIELIGIPLVDPEPVEPAAVPRPREREVEAVGLYAERADRDVFYEDPPPGLDDDPSDILRASRRLEAELGTRPGGFLPTSFEDEVD